ncbi:MAG: GAF domain-containing protein [Chloroflexota bacterium]|nr:GAF domain-containing protein [Chloroflexota bacterium]
MIEFAPKSPSSTRVDLMLFRVRWVMLVLAFLLAWIEAGTIAFPATVWVWFVIVAILNLIFGILILTEGLSSSLSIITLVADTSLFGLLPYLAISHSNYLGFLSLFPALVAAIRFGPAVGLAIAGLLSVSLGVHVLLLSARQAAADPGATLGTIAAMLGLTLLVGYLSQHEKEAAVKQAAEELDDLRGAMAGAKLLYHTADVMNLTTSYKTVLEGMLEAGVAGFPETRRADGLPVGLALFFDEKDPTQKMRVIAGRNLDKHDVDQSIPGKTGIVAEALKAGAAVVFEQVAKDPELSVFSALQRCDSGVCYPLQAALEQYGVVVLASPAPRRPSERHLELMRAFTSQAGIAFQNAKLYQSTRLEQDKIIHDENEMRQKLARDLHDGPTQQMAGLVMRLDYISHLLDKSPAEAKQELDKARATAQQTMKEIRTALSALRPLALETKGLSAALQQYGERLRETENIPIQIDPGNFGSELDMNIAATAFAIIDEAVNNARKHAQNAPIHVSVQRRENVLVATVEDQGGGFDVNRVMNSYPDGTSLGLQNMHDRAMLINGDLRIDSAPNRGTRVTLVVPLPPPNSEDPQ